MLGLNMDSYRATLREEGRERGKGREGGREARGGEGERERERGEGG